MTKSSRSTAEQRWAKAQKQDETFLHDKEQRSVDRLSKANRLRAQRVEKEARDTEAAVSAAAERVAAKASATKKKKQA
jgi:hypothetical protein